MKNSVKIKDRRSQLKSDAKSILNAAKRAKRELTDEEKAQVEEIKEEIVELDAQLEAIEEELALTEEEEVNSGEQEEPKPEEEEETKEVSDEEFEEDVEKIKESKRKVNSMNKKEQRFSILRAVRNIVDGKPQDAVTRAVIERGKQEALKAGLAVQGQIQIPADKRAAISVTTEHDDVIATDVLNIIEPLRAKNVLAQAGAKFMSGLVNDVKFPVMSASNVGWEGELAPAQDGAQTFTSVTLKPFRLSAYIDISRQFLVQDSVDAENVIREDLINAINSKLEETILGNGDGTSGGATVAPEGMFHALPAAATISTFADLCDAEADIEDANVMGEIKYVMSNKAKAALRAMSKGTKSTQLVYEDGEVDGVKAFNTSNVAGKNFIVGDWSNLVIGSWGNIDLVTDTVTQAVNGAVRLVVNAFFDAKILRTGAFKAGTIA